MRANLTKKSVDKLEHDPAKGQQQLYFDEDLKGFGIRVTRGSKTYFAEDRVNGKTRRVSIGTHGTFTLETARLEAQQLLLSMARGIDPQDQRKQEKAQSVTLAEVFEKYKGSRKLAPKTITIYTEALNRCIPDWLDKPITTISRDMVEKRLAKLSNKNSVTKNGFEKGSGKAQAGQVYRLLRSLFKFAMEEYETDSGPVIAVNPTNRLSNRRPWTENIRRQSCIQRHQLSDWFHKGVLTLEPDNPMRDYFILCLLTGLRRNEAISLAWHNVNLEGRYIRIAAENSAEHNLPQSQRSAVTKNHEEHRLPLSDYLVDMLQVRKNAEKLGNPFVFPAKGNATRHVVEPKASTKKVGTDSGVKFMTHDLRRTFITIAEMLDVPHYALKKLLNHKIKGDVTAGYIVTDVERLREPMQRITDFILKEAGVRQPASTPEATNMQLPQAKKFAGYQPLAVVAVNE